MRTLAVIAALAVVVSSGLVHGLWGVEAAIPQELGDGDDFLRHGRPRGDGVWPRLHPQQHQQRPHGPADAKADGQREHPGRNDAGLAHHDD